MKNLGSLEFKAEDFYTPDAVRDEAPLFAKLVEAWGKEAAEKANRILHERLEKAPQVWANRKNDVGNWHEAERRYSPPTHTARLVCIEKVGEEK